MQVQVVEYSTCISLVFLANKFFHWSYKQRSVLHPVGVQGTTVLRNTVLQYFGVLRVQYLVLYYFGVRSCLFIVLQYSTWSPLGLVVVVSYLYSAVLYCSYHSREKIYLENRIGSSATVDKPKSDEIIGSLAMEITRSLFLLTILTVVAGDVLHLTLENYDALTAGKSVFILFYAPWVSRLIPVTSLV